MRAEVSPGKVGGQDVKFCLVFPREALSVPTMRHVLGETLLGLGAEEDGVADLLLAVSEACTNVLQHGGPGRRYEVMASVDAAGCLIEVMNTGNVFDPLRAPGTRLKWLLWPSGHAVIGMRRRADRPAVSGGVHRRAARGGRHGRGVRPGRGRQATREEMLASLPESGRGLAIMRACVDDVTWRSAPEKGTVVALQKRIAWRSGAPLTDAPATLRDAG